MSQPLWMVAQAIPATVADGHGAPGLSLKDAAAAALLGMSLMWVAMQIWGRFRRTPAIEVEFATKAELREAVAAVSEAGERRRNEIREEIAALTRSFTTQMTDLSASIGRDNREQSVTLQAIQRTLGRLEGRQTD